MERGAGDHTAGRGRGPSATPQGGGGEGKGQASMCLLFLGSPAIQAPTAAASPTIPVVSLQVFFRLNEVDDMLDQVQKVAAGEVAARDLVLGAKMQVRVCVCVLGGGECTGQRGRLPPTTWSWGPRCRWVGVGAG